jgi:hypothetical protein
MRSSPAEAGRDIGKRLGRGTEGSSRRKATPEILFARYGLEISLLLNGLTRSLSVEKFARPR